MLSKPIWGSNWPVGGGANGSKGGVDRRLVACHHWYTKAMLQQRAGLHGTEIGAGDEQQVKGAAGQLALGKRDDLARSNITDAEIVGDAQAGDVHDSQATPFQPRPNSLIELVDVRR